MLDTATGSSQVAPKPRRRTKEERETTITWNELGSFAQLWTASPKEVRKWVALDLTVSPFNGGWATVVKKERIKITKPRVISPINSEKARIRLAAARAKKAEKLTLQNFTEFTAVSQPPSEPGQ